MAKIQRFLLTISPDRNIIPKQWIHLCKAHNLRITKRPKVWWSDNPGVSSKFGGKHLVLSGFLNECFCLISLKTASKCKCFTSNQSLRSCLSSNNKLVTVAQTRCLTFAIKCGQFSSHFAQRSSVKNCNAIVSFSGQLVRIFWCNNFRITWRHVRLVLFLEAGWAKSL